VVPRECEGCDCGSKLLGAQNISQGSQICGTATPAAVGLSLSLCGDVISNPDRCMDLPPLFYCVLSCDDGIGDRTAAVNRICE
jgi:hypothetical protein